jgi:membrane protease YdiL (CAAX protease family)
VGRAALLAASLLALALAPGALADAGLAKLAWLDALVEDPTHAFTATLTVLAGLLLLVLGPRAPGVWGLRRPAGLDAWALLPVAVAGALAGGVWLAPVGAPLAPPGLAALLGLPVAIELLFRGLVQGSLFGSFRVQRAGSRWFVSAPTLVSSGLYALVGLLPPLAALSAPGPWSGLHPLAPLAGAFAFGLAAGSARERSESIVVPIAFHWLGVGAACLALAA